MRVDLFAVVQLVDHGRRIEARGVEGSGDIWRHRLLERVETDASARSAGQSSRSNRILGLLNPHRQHGVVGRLALDAVAVAVDLPEALEDKREERLAADLIVALVARVHEPRLAPAAAPPVGL